jgi:hypothetical protein
LWRSHPPAEGVSHLLPEEEFLKRYEEMSGITVEPEKLHYCQVLNDLKAVGIITTATNAFAKNKIPDLRPDVLATLLDMAYAGLIQHLGGGYKV